MRKVGIKKKGIFVYHKDLEVWQEAMNLVCDIYKLTDTFPKHELFGITSQMRRCAVSIPSNIAEGCGRFSSKETHKFVAIALASLAELDTQVIISKRLGYMDDISIESKIKKVNALLLGLQKHLINKS